LSTGNSRQNKFKKFTPRGIRIPVSSVKGRCPRPLDDGGLYINTINIVLYLYLFVNGLVLT